MQRHDITAVILAGGQGRRMGGVDKGWVEFDGHPLIEHVLMALRAQVGTLLINANRSLERYCALNVDGIVEDVQGGFQGPLMGIYSALSASSSPWTLIAPCDTPRLPDTLVEALRSAVNTASADIAYARDNERDHPVVALIRTALADDLKVVLEQGERKIDRWYARHRHLAVTFDSADDFANINTPEECSRLQNG